MTHIYLFKFIISLLLYMTLIILQFFFKHIMRIKETNEWWLLYVKKKKKLKKYENFGPYI